MSEYESAKRKAKALRLTKDQARSVAASAYEKDLASGLPHLALKCAREFDLGTERVNRAASALVTLLLAKKRYSDALEIARGFNLHEADERVQMRLIEDARRLDPKTFDGSTRQSVEEIRKLASSAVHKRARKDGADDALAAIEAAAKARAHDARVKGRVVFLEPKGDVYLTGDLHGNVENLRRFAELADLENNPDRILVLQEIVHSRLITADQRDLSFVAILEALRLMARFPRRVYYLLGNHDLAFGFGRELIKGGKQLNRFLYKGLAYMYQGRHEEVAQAYQRFVHQMPAAIVAPNGILMTHSTPKKPWVPYLSMDYLVRDAARVGLDECGPIKAMVEGRDFAEDVIREFTSRMGVSQVVCGHTPTKSGVRIANSRQLIIDSQHENGRWIGFEAAQRYPDVADLAELVRPIVPDATSADMTGELM